MADSAAKARGMLQRRENLPPSSSHHKFFFLNIYHNVVFWRNGFTLNEGPLRRFDDPENAAFLDSIRKSECPKELEQPADGRCYVHLNLFRRDQNSPVFLEELEKRQPFQGVGRTLGSTTTTEVDLLEAGPIPPAQDGERKDCMKDRICGLPDEILIAILSLLTLKEAACTSVLSRRWRYLWRYITGRFNFDLKTLRAPSADGISLEEPTKYVSWVNEVLKLHLGTFIDEMRISFCFRGHFPRDINDWIKFAMEKGVQRFELDVLADVLPTLWCQCYDFPSMENFKFLFGTSNSRHVSRTIGSAAGFCSLTTLRLVGVNIMEEVLGNLLSICPFLEQLCIVASKCLVNLKIAGPSLRLKCLEISYCHFLENLEISAINLVSFTSVGRDISVSFKNVPLLSELSIGGEFCSSFVFGSCKHSSYIPQIEKLKLDVLYEDLYRFPKYFRELGNLKQVELFVIGHAGDSLLSLTSVIKASPNLSKFSVQLFLGANSREVARGDRRAYIDAVKEATKCHHQCLKVVELVGFVGRSNSEIDLVLHILEIAPSLEKIIINPRDIYFKNPLQSRKTFEAERERAWRLKPILPATIELVVL